MSRINIYVEMNDADGTDLQRLADKIQAACSTEGNSIQVEVRGTPRVITEHVYRSEGYVGRAVNYGVALRNVDRGLERG